MMPVNLIFVIFFAIKCVFSAESVCPPSVLVYNWSQTSFKSVNPSGSKLMIYCYGPKYLTKSLFKTWSSVKFHIKPNGELTLYHGENKTDVCYQYEISSKIWSRVLPFWQKNTFPLYPFNSSCLGVVSNDDYDIFLDIKSFDWKNLACFISGILIFFLAPDLSRNVIFHYGTGVSFGVLASLLVFAFVVGRFVPKKSVFYSVVVAGLSLSAYVWNYVYDNFINLIEVHFHYVIIYVVFASVVSFAVCYYKGPISNPRLLTLIQWAIQFLGILLIYLGSQLSEVTVVGVGFLFVVKLFKFKLSVPFSKPFARLWYKLFPPKIRLLTEEEYYLQATIETRKALDQLKDYCRSPDCDAWRTISKLNSPNRFARWIDGSMDHLTDEECYEHELSGDKYPNYQLDRMDYN